MRFALLVLVLTAACSKTQPPPPPVVGNAAGSAPPPAERPPPRDPVELGRELYSTKGCVACHTIDGSARVGPTFLHAFDTNVLLADGSKVKYDEAYVRESIVAPNAKVRAGFPPTQPSYEGQLTEAELTGLVAYVRSLK